MNRIDRLLGILVLLQSKKFVSAETIGDHYSISIRTVYRDIKALLEQGIPISFEPHKGYYIVQGYFLPPVSFNSDEANALLLMERLVEGFADRSISTHYTSALNKVKAVLKHSQKEKLEFLDSNIKMQLPECVKNEFQHLSVLQQAVVAQSILIIDYSSNSAEVSRREIEPIGLIFYAFNWHLIAWCHLRAQYRDFRVSRILKIINKDERFRKENHMSLNDYMKHLPVPY